MAVDKTSTLEDAIQDSGRQVLVMQNISPLAERLIGGEDYRFSTLPSCDISIFLYMKSYVLI